MIVLKTACRYTGDSLGHITVDLSSGGTGYFACGGRSLTSRGAGLPRRPAPIL